MRLIAIFFASCALGLTWVSRSKAARLSRESNWDIIHHEYHGPPAPLAKDGRVVDTPEVAKARTNHLAIHAETVADLAKKMAEWSTKKKSSEKSEDEVAEQQEQGAPVEAEPAPEAAKSESPAEDTKPVVEVEAANDASSQQIQPDFHFVTYEGPFATIGDDGRVLDTLEVLKAKEDHFLAHRQASELTKTNDVQRRDVGPGRYEARHGLLYPSSPGGHLLYTGSEAVGYGRPDEPLDEYGRVVDASGVHRTQSKRKRAREYAHDLANSRYSSADEANSV